MKKDFSRRAFVGSAIGATAGAMALTSACTSCTPSGVKSPVSLPKGRVNLIVHGMVAFVSDGGKLKIYIPSPMLNGKQVHEIRMGGLLGPVLAAKTDGYKLDLGIKDATDPYTPSAKQDVVVKLTGYSIERKAVHTFIEIPIPAVGMIRPARVMKHVNGQNESFFTGSGATQYYISPDSIPSTHVITYDNVGSKVRLTDPDGTHDYPIDGMPVEPSIFIRNIHIYSEPPQTVSMESHLPLYCNMFTKNGVAIDIQRDNSVSSVQCAIQDEPMAGNTDLSVADLASLSETDFIYHPDHDKGKHAGDPADCINGWVTF